MRVDGSALAHRGEQRQVAQGCAKLLRELRVAAVRHPETRPRDQHGRFHGASRGKRIERVLCVHAAHSILLEHAEQEQVRDGIRGQQGQ